MIKASGDQSCSVPSLFAINNKPVPSGVAKQLKCCQTVLIDNYTVLLKAVVCDKESQTTYRVSLLDTLLTACACQGARLLRYTKYLVWIRDNKSLPKSGLMKLPLYWERGHRTPRLLRYVRKTEEASKTGDCTVMSVILNTVAIAIILQHQTAAAAACCEGETLSVPAATLCSQPLVTPKRISIYMYLGSPFLVTSESDLIWT